MLQAVQTQEPSDPVPGGGAGNPLSWLLAWRERRFAAERSRQLMRLHGTVSTAHPGLAKAALYRRIVAARIGEDELAVERVLRQADESFASWPVPRALNFRDVVHYLVVSEFQALSPGARGMQADIRPEVHAVVPVDL
jgi:hypothetical protein